MFAKCWKWDLEQIFSSLECFSFPRRHLLKVVWGAEFHFDFFMELHLTEMRSSDTGITYTLDFLGSSFRLKSYNKLRKTMLPAFPVYHALESHRIEANQVYTALQTNKHRWELGREPTKGYCWFSRSHIFKKMTGNLLNLIFFSFVSQKVNCLKW